MVTVAEYAGPQPTWCPGCGNFGILKALKQALVELGLEPYQVLIVSGIGQAGKTPHYIKCNVLNMLHGRTLPAASAAKIANRELVVIAVAGDGDGYGEGGNHFIHALRRNHDITFLVHNNQVYGLTKGQMSPTSDAGFITKTSPYGSPAPVHPLSIAIAAGGSFVARGFAGDVPHLAGLLKSAIRHSGFAFVDVLQPCVTFNHRNTYAWYRERVYKLEDNGYDPVDRIAALLKSQEWGDRIPIGVVYREERAVYESRFPALAKGPLVAQMIDPRRVESLLDELL
jgi:2-oxoglutarate ferredoxin oxidoreductase subunit beta